ncbi:hypothetical protein K488DRAFT_43367 [Vararia minispora EC-137]|uniref:Uncharacterized protein n=1 Tax=Vararia minispora EC-137 TaxID=1314806 RepID=A0ACB8QUS7_9AGAM|nr:hypothetical protein K488DRAFT_43367 [Vararia minispora EC-137]
MSNGVYDGEGRLREEYVQDCFHSYLKSSLAQAKAEKLLDVPMLSSAESDLMVTGPALCLYFAALRCTTSPPSVPLPRKEKRAPHIDLSESNCPRPFISFLQLWALAVPDIQSLEPEAQHDLARIICGLGPLSRSPNPWLYRVAADLRSVAIEISLRRSFQNRYAGDLQAAIDTGAATGISAKASFVPPPEYTLTPTETPHSTKSPPTEPLHPRPRINTTQNGNNHLRVPETPASASKLLSPTSPAIELIRETLYAALADVLSITPSLRAVLRTDPPRAYFGAVALAILSVACSAVTPDGAVRGVMGQPLTLEACPAALRPLMMELAAIGRAAGEIEEQDTEEAMRRAAAGEDVPAPRLERVRAMLERGAGHDVAERGGGCQSVEGRAVAFANRVNALALNMTRLPAFRERQEEVFKVLSGVE